MGAFDYKADLDLIRMVRRMRMYGIGLYYTMQAGDRKLSARLAAQKPLRMKEDKGE